MVKSLLFCTNASVCDAWIVQKVYGMRAPYVGFDTESKPGSRVAPAELALVQLATASGDVLIYRVHGKKSASQWPAKLLQLLNDKDVFKCGVGLGNDLDQLSDVGVRVTAIIDAQTLAKQVFGVDHQLGMRTLAARCLGLAISKPTRVARSDWSREVLSQAQLRYAGQDPWLALCVTRWLVRRLRGLRGPRPDPPSQPFAPPTPSPPPPPPPPLLL